MAAPQPWHQLCKIREDVRTGTLTLDEFAADLNAVRTGEAPAVYKNPDAFFSRTYPTYKMKTLVRDVLHRLAGEGGKPILHIQVAYGGGKTHTLITLLHLAEHGAEFAGHPTVREFLDFAGLGGGKIPRTRVALLPFDKFGVKEGLTVLGPDGKPRTVKTPWGALAYQLGGDAAFARVKEQEEDYATPAEPLLIDLLKLPQAEGLSTLILIDEAVWYYRSAVNDDPRRLGTLKDFYQVLTQAVAKVKRSAMVAALIASRVEAADETGAKCLKILEDVFGRMAEAIEPVVKDDVSEVLRRRLFEVVPGEEQRRPGIDALMAQMQKLPLRDAQKDQAAYNRLMQAYPFHPDLIDVLYSKWTQFSGFQRTRGALRLLALALRNVGTDDPFPVIGPRALLSKDELSPAIVELINCCEEKEKWTPILRGELDKAREAQSGFPSLKDRELEQAVIATFLHSQPTGQRADPSELYALLAHPKVDALALGEALKKWRDLSWFLIEDSTAWALSTRPNLTHMHVRAMERLIEPAVDDELRKRIQGTADLKQADDGVIPHALPQGPQDVPDNVEGLRYLILGPECAVDPGKPLPKAVEDYFKITTGPKNPRTYANTLVALAPDHARLAGLRDQVRRFLGWRGVETSDEFKLLSDLQRKELARRKQASQDGLPDAVRATYSVLLAVDETGRVVAKAIPSEIGQPPFERIKKLLSESERLLVSTLDPELLLPGSYFELWGPDEKSKKVKDLVSAFAQFPRLPRLLRPRALRDTLVRGVQAGKLVLRLVRDDGSTRTFWMLPPDEDTLARPQLEVLSADTAELANLDPELLIPGAIPELWPVSGDPVRVASLRTFFDGERAPRLHSPDVLDAAIRAAVQRGSLMARQATKTYLREPLPAGALADDLELLAPPPAVRGADLGPKGLAEAWHAGKVSLADVADALAKRRGYAVPWVLLRDGVSEALSAHLFEVTEGSVPWPCSPDALDRMMFHTVEVVAVDPTELVGAGVQYAWSDGTPTLRKIKEALETSRGQVIPGDVFRQAVEGAVNKGLITLADLGVKALPTADALLKLRVRLPKATLAAEAALTPKQLQDLVGIIAQLKQAAPDLEFAFRAVITAEGEKPSDEVLAKLNELLKQVKAGWKIE